MPLDTDAKKAWAEREIAAPAADIFAVLADPSRHHEFDGSGTVREATGTPGQVKLGDKFGMKMRWGVPYAVRSKVVEFEQDRLIAWAHFGRHRWRYELEPLSADRTKVTETFDYAPALSAWVYERMGIPEQHVANIEKTLERLDALLTE